MGARCHRELLPRPIVVLSTFGRLFVEDTVRMEAVRMLGVVAEDDLDCVANLGANHRPEDPEVFPLRLSRLEFGE